MKRTEYFECQCHSLQHVLRVNIWDWGKHDRFRYNLVFDYSLLNHKNFCKRVVLGLKYIFCYNKTFNAWGETIIRDEDIPRLKAIIAEYEGLTSENK